MMPFWLQLVCALSAGITAAVMGIALIPYLQKLRFFPPEQSASEDAEGIREERKPSMGGLLLLGGILFSLVLSVTLWLQFSGTDRTSLTTAAHYRRFLASAAYTGVLCAIGILSDYLIIRGKYNRNLWNYILLPLVLAAAVLIFRFLGFTTEELYSDFRLLVLAAPACLCFVLEYGLERDTDGMLISVNAAELLILTILFLRKACYLPSILTLAGAGACLGCMMWCLHPAKCRIGKTGCYLLGGLLPSLCLTNGMYRELALFMAVGILQQLYRLHKHENTYLTEAMTESGISPYGRIVILAGLAVLCGGIALFLK